MRPIPSQYAIVVSLNQGERGSIGRALATFFGLSVTDERSTCHVASPNGAKDSLWAVSRWPYSGRGRALAGAGRDLEKTSLRLAKEAGVYPEDFRYDP